MKLTIRQLNIILEDNEQQLKQALSTNDVARIIELMNHRAIVKDCIIELLTDKLNHIESRLYDFIDSKC
jgi:hypothetical protein